MNLLKLMAGGAATGAILLAFRDFRNGGWLSPALPRGTAVEVDETEPILGYDGMDQETLLEWLRDADLEREALIRIRNYEMANRDRELVLEAVEDML